MSFHRWQRENRTQPGMRGVYAAIRRHERTLAQAEAILKIEHGVRHEAGSHELCPLCQSLKSEKTPERQLERLDGIQTPSGEEKPRSD